MSFEDCEFPPLIPLPDIVKKGKSGYRVYVCEGCGIVEVHVLHRR